MSAQYYGGEVKYTKRHRLGQLTSGLTRHFLLMTATPQLSPLGRPHHCWRSCGRKEAPDSRMAMIPALSLSLANCCAMACS